MKISELKSPYKELALANQKLQGNEPDENVHLSTGRAGGAFNWPVTFEGYNFWYLVSGRKTPMVFNEIKANYPDLFPVEGKDELTKVWDNLEGLVEVNSEQLASALPIGEEEGFIVGSKVYDQFNFPNEYGVVKNIDQYIFTIEFLGKEYYYPYKNDGTSADNFVPKQLSSTPYILTGFTPIKFQSPNHPITQ